jgi:hypothetical protein
VRWGKRVRESRERTTLGNQRRKLPCNVIHAAFAESDAHFADVPKFGTIEHSQDQAAELSAPSPRLGKAGNHGFQMEMSLYLQPGIGSAPFDVGTGTILGNDPFQAHLGNGFEECHSGGLDVLTDADARQRRKQCLQKLFSLAQGCVAQILPVQVQEVEDV